MADESKTAVSDSAKHSLGEEAAKKGAFVRRPSKFATWIKADGSTDFPAEKGRYHLIVADACPWAHRTRLVRALKGLEDVISMSVTSWNFVYRSGKTGFSHTAEDPTDYRGWAFAEPEPLFGCTSLGDFYEKACPGYYASFGGKRVPISVPVLFDKKTQTIVNNESAEIIMMFNSEFNEWATNPDLDLAPKDLAAAMSEVDGFIYPGINDGVYRNGFARSQEAYDDAAAKLWKAMDRVEALLGERRYIAGDRFTLSDVRLFTTLVRFDPVYVTHFKVNRNRIIDMPNIFNYVKEVYQMPHVADTILWELIRKHYYTVHTSVNPFGIVPVGFMPDFTAAHDRATKFPVGDEKK